MKHDSPQQGMQHGALRHVDTPPTVNARRDEQWVAEVLGKLGPIRVDPAAHRANTARKP